MSLKVSAKSVFLSMMSAIALAGFSVPMVLAEPVTFTLVNDTSRDLLHFYASPPSTNDWEEDILGSGVLPAGSSVQVTINDGRTDCDYDIKGVLGPSPDGTVGPGELIHSAVNICAGSTYTYSEN